MDLNNIPIRLDKPYPELVGVRPNLMQAKMLKNLAADNKSELKAILQYLYQHYILDDYEPEIAKILEGLSIVEMTHYELLNEAILKLGGNVEVSDSLGQPFSSKAINYEKNLYKLLNVDIEGEQSATEAYVKTAEAVSSNGNLSELMLRIAEDETHHVKVLENILIHLKK